MGKNNQDRKAKVRLRAFKKEKLLRMDILSTLYKRGFSYREMRSEVMARLALKSYSLETVKKDIDSLLETLLDAVTGGEIGMSSLRAAAGDLYSIPGLTPRGRTLADSINESIDRTLKEYIQR